MRRVADLIDAHLHEPLTIGALARAAALSPFHFARSFRLTTGLTPHNYLRQARLQRAAALARSSALSTTEIAHRVGYKNVAHFRQAFMRAFGTTPAALRALPR
jgi:AraC family transcriptional regulator